MKYIYGNWKMAQPYEAARSFLAEWDLKAPGVELCFFPSYVHLDYCIQEGKRRGLDVKFGAQDCSTEEQGAFTGEISAKMLKEMGASHVLIGHSEKRARASETNETLSAKMKQALLAGLSPVFCLGETEKQRDEGKVFETLEYQLGAVSTVLGNANRGSGIRSAIASNALVSTRAPAADTHQPTAQNSGAQFLKILARNSMAFVNGFTGHF